MGLVEAPFHLTKNCHSIRTQSTDGLCPIWDKNSLLEATMGNVRSMQTMYVPHMYAEGYLPHV